MSRDDAARRVREIAERELTDADLAISTKRAIVLRMLHNLQGVAAQARDAAGLLRYLNALLAVDADLAQEHWMRAVVSFQLDRKETSRLDVEWLLNKQPPGIDLDRLHDFQQLLDRDQPWPSGPAQ
jgi:regulator of sirC expression with transglutaminase-like and TPR domain